MKSKYWIKLYHEILDDPKMGRLSDRLWRKTIEVFLLAGDHDKNGALPSIENMAWRLRISVVKLHADLVRLQEWGIVSCSEDDHWSVTQFNVRQRPMSGKERTKLWRQSQRSGDGIVTESHTLTEVDTEVEQETEEEEEQQTINVVVALTKIGISEDKIIEFLEDFNIEEVAERIRQYEFAAEEGIASTPGYLIRAITQDWKPPRGYKPDATSERERRKFLEGDL